VSVSELKTALDAIQPLIRPIEPAVNPS
jgi:hypothetical protein